MNAMQGRTQHYSWFSRRDGRQADTGSITTSIKALTRTTGIIDLRRNDLRYLFNKCTVAGLT